MFSLFPFRAFIVSGENEPVLTGKRTVLEESMNILESPGGCVFPGDCHTSLAHWFAMTSKELTSAFPCAIMSPNEQWRLFRRKKTVFCRMGVLLPFFCT